jgi:hypothetical protein
VVSPTEQGEEKYKLLEYENYKLLKIRTIQGANKNLIKKGLNTILLERWYINAVKKYLENEKFDLILYSTPPITLYSAIKYIKKKSNAISYLMLKDIFPQNAVDLGMMTSKGIRSLPYWYFRHKEKNLYSCSDYIGCMSEANVKYFEKHNSDVPKEKVGLCVNSVIPLAEYEVDKEKLKKRFHLPLDATIFFYGGNFGKPQGIQFLLQVLEANMNCTDRYFVLCGKGSEYVQVEKFLKRHSPDNMRLINGLPKQEYDMLLTACDVGMIFLDYRFTIPNFPSRILPYMEYAIPVLSVTDRISDIGDKIEQGNFGWKCYSDDIARCNKTIDNICRSDELQQKGRNGRRFLEENYTAKITYNQIMEQIG